MHKYPSFIFVARSTVKCRCQFEFEVDQSLSRFELPLKRSDGSKLFFIILFEVELGSYSWEQLVS